MSAYKLAAAGAEAARQGTRTRHDRLDVNDRGVANQDAKDGRAARAQRRAAARVPKQLHQRRCQRRVDQQARSIRVYREGLQEGEQVDLDAGGTTAEERRGDGAHKRGKGRVVCRRDAGEALTRPRRDVGRELVRADLCVTPRLNSPAGRAYDLSDPLTVVWRHCGACM